MEKIVYLNGQWLPLSKATVNVEDRGFMFADGLYEVIRFYNGHPIAMSEHVERLKHGLDALRIKLPCASEHLTELSRELVGKNNLDDAVVYWQITRGVAPRNHNFPSPAVEPTILLIAYPACPFIDDAPTPLIRAITQPDNRWLHCEIKTTQLLPNVLARQAASDAGKDESILIREDETVTEATARSIFIAKDGVLQTYPLDGRILDSITRQVVIELAAKAGIKVVQTPFDHETLKDADEIIAVGTNTEVASIIELDGVQVGDGKPGPMTRELFGQYRKFVKSCCELG